MSFNFAYLSGGKLYLKLGRETIQAIASEFGQAMQQRGFDRQRRNGWKKNPMANFMPAGMGGDSQAESQGIPVAVQGVCSTSADRLLYTLEAGEIGGIFTLERTGISIATEGSKPIERQQKIKEKRLFHSAEFKIDRVDFNPAYQLIACAAIGKDGSANIATMTVNSVHLSQVTEGDSIDLAPKWIPGFRRALVFQSSGICRDRAGYIVEHKHSTIEQLDLDRHEVITLASDPKYDLLCPQIAADSTLYYIRRPYRPLRQRVPLVRLFQDAALMPIRLFIAVFEWLNFFTQRYTGKSLLALPPIQRSQGQQMLFLGRVVDVDAQIQRNSKFGEPDSPALVPRSWELIKQLPHREPEVVAQGVLAFDVGADGQIIYSNGSAVYGILPGGLPQRLVVDRPIDQVVILDGENDLN